jgi:hypothetical protein
VSCCLFEELCLGCVFQVDPTGERRNYVSARRPQSKAGSVEFLDLRQSSVASHFVVLSFPSPAQTRVISSLIILFYNISEPKLSEEYCTTLADKATKPSEVPEACKQFASVKAKLESKSDPYAGMSAGSRTNVRNAQIKRRMSTRHGQGPQGKKTSWF